MPAVVGGQIDAIGLMVRRDNQAADVENSMLGQVLFVDAQHVRRRGGEDLGVVIECEAVDVAEIAGFADPQDDRLLRSR